MIGSKAALLLKDFQEEKNLGILGGLFKSSKSATETVHRGELLHSLPRAKVTARKDGRPAHNYQLANDPSVTLFCPDDDVALLNDYEYNLMIPIKSREARLEVHQKEILNWGSRLKKGTLVYVALPSRSLVSNQRAVAVIRYIGPLPKEEGVQFGVEIQVNGVLKFRLHSNLVEYYATIHYMHNFFLILTFLCQKC